MKENRKINILLLIISISLMSCKKNLRHLESEKDTEARFIITNYNDSILISYSRYNKKNDYPPLTLIRKGDDYWHVENELRNNENEFITLSDKKKPNYIFLSKEKHKAWLEDEASLINDSILTYQKDGKYMTEIKANEKPVNYYYYYDKQFNIDSIILIRLNDTIIYK